MLGALIGGGLGALAGAQPDKINAGSAGVLEQQANAAIGKNFGELSNFTDMGPGATEVQQGLRSQQDLASTLASYAKGGFLPTAADNNTAQNFAQSQFQPQQVAMQQGFKQQQQRAAQLAAQLGRPVNDPIIQARLSQEMMQGNERLQASQGAFASNFAQSLPQQRLGYTSQLADVRSSLASQAMANRQALIGLGSQIQTNERNFRVQTASRGGGLKGALTGAIAGAGAGMGAEGMLNQQDLMTAQTGFWNTAAKGVGQGLGQALGRGAVQSMAQPQAPEFSQQAPSSTYGVPYALQPNMTGNSMPYAAPQFNMFGMMGNGQNGTPNNFNNFPVGTQPSFPTNTYQFNPMNATWGWGR